MCENPPVRKDHLDAIVWAEVVRLLEDANILQEELDRRLEAARNADPLKQRQECLRRDHARLAKGMDRLSTAYQEGLMSLDQLRCRMPELRRQGQAIQAELHSLEMAGDHTKYLRLVETLGDFRTRLRARADSMDVIERQKSLRLLVKEVLVGKETITIRHCIRLPTPAPVPNVTPRPPHEQQRRSTHPVGPCYLLRSGSIRGGLVETDAPVRRPVRLSETKFGRHTLLSNCCDGPMFSLIGSQRFSAAVSVKQPTHKRAMRRPPCDRTPCHRSEGAARLTFRAFARCATLMRSSP